MEPEEKSLKSQFRRADKLRARFVVILGTEELEKSLAIVRIMENKSQEEVPLSELVDYFTLKHKKERNFAPSGSPLAADP